MSDARLERVRALLAAARRIVDPDDELGARARAELFETTGLSFQGVELGLAEHVETEPTDEELSALLAAVPHAAAAHVILSAGVFVGAHRAVALALAASSTVYVKPSRRDPVLARLLAEAAPGLFTIVEGIAARAGDIVFAYGADETLAAIRDALPPGVFLRGHGTGFGVALIEARRLPDEELSKAAELVAKDVVPFDQRGCLSPRIVMLSGDDARAHAFSDALAGALSAAEERIPRGRISSAEAAEMVRYRDTMLFAGSVRAAGAGWVGLDLRGERAVLPPPGRNVHVTRVQEFGPLLVAISRFVTALGIGGSRELAEWAAEVLPFARRSELGKMQRPLFDGPVDRRRPSSEHPEPH